SSVRSCPRRSSRSRAGSARRRSADLRPPVQRWRGDYPSPDPLEGPEVVEHPISAGLRELPDAHLRGELPGNGRGDQHPGGENEGFPSCTFTALCSGPLISAALVLTANLRPGRTTMDLVDLVATIWSGRSGADLSPPRPPRSSRRRCRRCPAARRR